MASPAIFLDRDGVLNVNRDDHVKCWAEFRFLPGALASLRMLGRAGIPIVVVTNQAIINRGIVTRADVESIHLMMKRRILAAGGRVDLVLYCPHTTAESCDCRKPEPGLLRRAAEELDIDLSRSVLVGDALSDVEAGRRAGCRTVLVRTGRGEEALAQLASPLVQWPDLICSDLRSSLPALVDVLQLAANKPLALAMRQQDRKHEEIAGQQIAAHLSDAAFDS